MDKSGITWTSGTDWWLSRRTMKGRERYPKQIRVGDLDSPRAYYPINRAALLALADEMEQAGKDYRYQMVENACCDNLINDAPDDFIDYARRIREALGASE